jgi:hypothetical protein
MNEPTPETSRPATGEHPATHEEVRRWGWVHALLGSVGVGGIGAVIVFLVSYAGSVEAKSVAAAHAVAVVQAQRIDVLKGDVDVVKVRLEAVDAGVARRLDELEKKVEAAQRRSEQRADAQEAMLREVLREVRKR